MDTQFGKYRIEGTLGTGTMGVVYRAFDQRLQRPVALKTVRSELLASAAWEHMLDRFQHEAVAAGRLIHPNIVTVFDFGVENDTAYIAMELVEGSSLKTFMAEHGHPDLHLVGHLVVQLLRALEVAHEAGIIHRDIKPANLMIASGQRLKVTDFGVARLDASDMTHSGAVVGTPNYMAPEQYAGAAIDGRADLFSAAVILYELICGQRPFRRSASRDSWDQDSFVPAPPGSLASGVPPELDAVVLKGLARRAADRYTDARAFRHALADALRNLPEWQEAPESSGDESVPLRPGAASGSASGVGPARTAPHGSAATTPATFSESVLASISEALVEHVGPIARALVRKAAREASGTDELRKRLAECINTLEGKAAFNQAFGRLVPGSASPAAPAAAPAPMTEGPAAAACAGTDEHLSQLALSDVEGLLVHYVGPIARVLVRKAVKETAGRRPFCERLAEHISDPGQRSRFLSEALLRSQASGPA